MNDDQVFGLLMETNPVPDVAGLESPIALSPPERRSVTPVDTMVRIDPESPEPSRARPRWGIAIAAAAVVLVGLGALFALTMRDGTLPAAADLANDPARIEALLLGEMTNDKAQAWIELLAPDSAIDYRFRRDPASPGAILVPGSDRVFWTSTLAWSVAMNQTSEGACEQTGAHEATCSFTSSNDLDQAIGRLESVTVVITFDASGLITRQDIIDEETIAAGDPRFYDEFRTWALENHGDVYDQAFVTGVDSACFFVGNESFFTGAPCTTREGGALMAELLAEFYQR